MKTHKSISFITTCKGRLHHLQQTLPLMLESAPNEIIVVDYNCPDQTRLWVQENYPSVKVVCLDDDFGFSISRARNFGAQSATSDWVCFIDADIKVSNHWVSWMHANLEEGAFYRAAPVNGERVKDTWGTCIVLRNIHNSIGGFDEAMHGWGGEDDDYYKRLSRTQTESTYPHHFVEPISHDDEERTKFYDINDKALSLAINLLYTKLKYALLAKYKLPHFSVLFRQELRRKVAEAYKNCKNASTWHITIRLDADLCRINGIPGYKDTLINICMRRRYMLFGPRSLTINIYS